MVLHLAVLTTVNQFTADKRDLSMNTEHFVKHPSLSHEQLDGKTLAILDNNGLSINHGRLEATQPKEKNGLYVLSFCQMHPRVEGEDP